MNMVERSTVHGRGLEEKNLLFSLNFVLTPTIFHFAIQLEKSCDRRQHLCCRGDCSDSITSASSR